MPLARLVHFSDIHLPAKPLGLRLRDAFSKRLTGWVNLKLGRGRKFREGPTILDALFANICKEPVDAIVFSGDATVLGYEAEVVSAVRQLHVGEAEMPPGIAVPGNHDYYVKASVTGAFERHFAPWQQGIRVDEAVYPFARRVGGCWVIAVNSATPNWGIWNARGMVGPDQRRRLERLLAQLDSGPRILVTHYPLMLPTGTPEKRWRRLRDADELLPILIAGKVRVWLHGHRHDHYCHAPTAARPIALICAGSATQRDRSGYNTYAIHADHLIHIRHRWNEERSTFVQEALVHIPLVV